MNPKTKMIKLLIIDDEEDICKFGKSYFEKRGIETYATQNGTEAITLAKRINPNIALIDIHVGKESGIDILRELLQVCPKCKCIMLTWDKEMAIEAMKMGAVDFVRKPSLLEDLENSVNRIIKTLNRKKI